MSEEPKSNDSSEIITQVLDELKKEPGTKFSLQEINLAELERRTGISRSRLRKLQQTDFIPVPHGNLGRHKVTVLSGYTRVVDAFLMNGVSNSSVILDHLRTLGYAGGRTQHKAYIYKHKDLIPAKRQTVDSQGKPLWQHDYEAFMKAVGFRTKLCKPIRPVLIRL